MGRSVFDGVLLRKHGMLAVDVIHDHLAHFCHSYFALTVLKVSDERPDCKLGMDVVTLVRSNFITLF